MNNVLVAYFSASGITKKIAEKLAGGLDSDILEIEPKIPYTEDDLDWMNSKSRSSIEMSDKSSRPKLKDGIMLDSKYDIIFVGFPIWWYVAPTIINTFLETCDLNGKTIIPFATSGSSGMGNTNKDLVVSCKGAILKEGKRFPSNASKEDLVAWAKMFL